MMLADLHTHTNTSHGHHSAAEMYEGAVAAASTMCCAP